MSLDNPRFEASYSRLFGVNVSYDEDAGPFFDEFYRRFLEAPAVEALFTHTDMARQKTMMKRSLFMLVSFYVTGTPSGELRRLAQIHKRLGLAPAMFDDWMAALIDTVSCMDGQADEATLLAWCWALSPGVTYMRLSLQADATI